MGEPLPKNLMNRHLNPKFTLHEPLYSMWPLAKMLWLYFNLTGPLEASQRELSVKLGVTQRAVAENLNKLSEAKLIRYKPGKDRGSGSKSKALKPIFSPIDKPSLGVLKDADASTKVLYLWLLPQGKAPYTHKEVAANLGITDMTAVKARQKLEAFGAIAYERRPAPRQHGIYYVLSPKELEQRRDIDENLALPGDIDKGKAAELKLYYLIEQQGRVPAHQQNLATLVDIPQSAVSKSVTSLVDKGLIERAVNKGVDVLVLAGEQKEKRSKRSKSPIPDKLKGEANAVQLLYMWLKPQGKVSYSYSDIVELVRIRSYSVMKALGRLEELGLLEMSQKPSPHSQGTFKIVS